MEREGTEKASTWEGKSDDGTNDIILRIFSANANSLFIGGHEDRGRCDAHSARCSDADGGDGMQRGTGTADPQRVIGSAADLIHGLCPRPN